MSSHIEDLSVRHRCQVGPSGISVAMSEAYEEMPALTVGLETIEWGDNELEDYGRPIYIGNDNGVELRLTVEDALRISHALRLAVTTFDLTEKTNESVGGTDKACDETNSEGCPSWCVQCHDVGDGVRLHESSVRTMWVLNRETDPATQRRIALQRSLVDGKEPTIYIGCIYEDARVPTDLFLLDPDSAAGVARELLALSEVQS